MLSWSLAQAAANAQSGDVVGKIDRGVDRAMERSAQLAPQPEAAAPRAIERASLLKGKLKFALPEGFVGSPLPPGARMGTADVKGTVYANPGRKQLVITGEWRTPSGVRVKDDDRLFLERARADYIAQMQKSLPDYEILGDKALRIKGLGIRQTEGLSTFGNVRTLSTSLLAASGATQSVVRIISRAEDGGMHQAVVASVIEAMRTSR
jgi:hypothetical protein